MAFVTVSILGVQEYCDYSQVGYTTFTFSAEPIEWRRDRQCRDAGRIIFGNILTPDYIDWKEDISE